MTGAIERFLDKVHVNGSTGCWEWTASLNLCGYGRFKFDGKTIQAHRFSYAFFVGEMPEGMQMDHLCRTRRCVNPDHLEPVTPSENLERAFLHLGVCRNGLHPKTIPGRCQQCLMEHNRRGGRRRRARLKSGVFL